MRAKAHESHSIPEDLCGDKCGIKPFGKCFLHILLGHNSSQAIQQRATLQAVQHVATITRSIMDCRLRNVDWKDNEKLEEDPKRYVAENLRGTEILDFVKREYHEYAWSLRILNRRLSYFKIRYNDYDTDLNELENAVRQEMDCPGALLGYRALHKKIREVHGLKVPRNMVYDMMYMVDPTGLDERGSVGRLRRSRRTKKFTSKVRTVLLAYESHGLFDMPHKIRPIFI